MWCLRPLLSALNFYAPTDSFPILFQALTAMFAYNMGILITIFISFDDYLTSLVQHFAGTDHWYSGKWVFILGVVIIAPTAYFKNIAKFTCTTNASQLLLNTSFVLMMVELIRLAMVTESGAKPSPPPDFVFQVPLLSAISGISYLYCCHDMAFHVLYTLKNPTRARWTVVACSSQLSLAMIFLLLGLLGAFYVGNTQNVLDNFSNSVLVLITRFLAALSLWLCIPYSVYMPRIVIFTVLTRAAPAMVVKSASNKTARTLMHALVTTVILAACLCVALLVDSLGVFVEFVGLSGLCISLILPPACFLRLSPEKWWATLENKITSAILGLGLLLFVGCILSLIFPS